VFEKHRAKKALKEYQVALAAWQAERDGCAHLLETALHFEGTGADGLQLGPGEAVFFQVTRAALIEERRGAGQWQGHSAGVSIPIGSLGGHSVRYRVGTTRGHYVQGTPAPTAIDTGTVYVTNQRVVFEGESQTRECRFAKLLGYQHSDGDGSTTFSVSNRQKPVTLHYGPHLSGAFDFRLDLALAHCHGTVPDLVGRLTQDLGRIDGMRPSSPPTPPS